MKYNTRLGFSADRHNRPVNRVEIYLFYLNYSLRKVNWTEDVVEDSKHDEIWDILIHAQLERNGNHVHNNQHVHSRIKPEVRYNVIQTSSYRVIGWRNDFRRVDFFQTFDLIFLQNTEWICFSKRFNSRPKAWFSYIAIHRWSIVWYRWRRKWFQKHKGFYPSLTTDNKTTRTSPMNYDIWKPGWDLALLQGCSNKAITITI